MSKMHSINFYWILIKQYKTLASLLEVAQVEELNLLKTPLKRRGLIIEIFTDRPHIKGAENPLFFHLLIKLFLLNQNNWIEDDIQNRIRYCSPIYVSCVSSHLWPFTKAIFFGTNAQLFPKKKFDGSPYGQRKLVISKITNHDLFLKAFALGLFVGSNRRYWEI